MQFRGGEKHTIFNEFGGYLLVECKNWKSSVGAPQVRDFLGKLGKSRVRLGVLFAKNGISGANKGQDALREIHSAVDSDGTYIVVISEEDLEAVKKGADFYRILD